MWTQSNWSFEPSLIDSCIFNPQFYGRSLDDSPVHEVLTEDGTSCKNAYSFCADFGCEIAAQSNSKIDNWYPVKLSWVPGGQSLNICSSMSSQEWYNLLSAC